MPKASLEFNLPEENREHCHAINAVKYWVALEDVKEYFRRKLKYSELTEAESKFYEHTRDDVYNIINLEIYD